MQSLTTNTTTAAAGTGPSFQETMIELTPQSSSAAQGSNLYSFDRVFLQRLGRLLRILFQSSGHDRFWSTSKRARQSSVFWLYVVFVTVSCGNEVLYYYVGLLPSRFYGLLSSQDLPGFSAFILPCLVLVFGAAAGRSLLKFLGGLFALKTRRLLTQHTHDVYIKPKTMYSIVFNEDDDIDNPDQRITQDIEKFSDSLREIVENLIIAPVLVLYYTWKCFQVSGIYGPLMIYGYFVLGSLLSRALIKPIVSIVFYKELAEGDFRFLHVRLRQFAESIAFSKGEIQEHEKAKEKLDTLLGYQRSIVNREFPLSLANEGFAYFGSILSYLIVAIPIFAGAFEGKDPGQLSEIISKNSFFAMYLISRFTTIIEQSAKLSDLAGYTARIGELLEAIDDIDDEMDAVQVDDDDDHFWRDNESSKQIVFRDVQLTLPSGRTLLTDFNLTIRQSVHTAIVGPNGSGKSSLLRTLAGLWRCSSGQVKLPSDRILFLPQTPYLVEGSLRDQIAYPDAASAAQIPDRIVRDLLRQVRLEHLEMLIESFDTPYAQEWSKLLSPGEQQRLVFTRILYKRPQFAALDEATSAMDEDTETHLYQLLDNIGTTMISVSHHPNVVGFHKQIVTLDGAGGYTVQQSTIDGATTNKSTQF